MHIPVMLDEVIKYLNPKDGETYVDCTFGRGGYTKAILDAADVSVFALDCDPDAALFAKNFKSKLSKPENFHFIEGNFKDIEELLESNHVNKVDGIILDLGVSSVQLDDADRGFSFSKEAKLDMRMSREGYSAYEFINQADEKTIADVIYKYGDEHNSFKIARSIVKARSNKVIETTTELASIVKSAFFSKKS
jgi:16S rRNA (cytosine1402-N4)-methyltransferase